MGLIASIYKKKFVCRYDKEVGIPYYSHLDFKGLKQEAYSFKNSKGFKINYFYYYFNNFDDEKIILFLHGIGPGHTAYLAEIKEIAKRGYKVLTLDYEGCGSSEGKMLGSLNTPTRNVMELLDYLDLHKEITVVGHSLGGYTALNILNVRSDIARGITLSAFLSIESLVSSMIKSKFLVKGILKYEKKVDFKYFDLNNLEFLKNTGKSLLCIHSLDDTMVPYETSLAKINELDNPNIKVLIMDNRKHNPNYTDDAVKYMNEVFGKYNYLVKTKKIKTDQQKIDYFKDVSLEKLTKQDKQIFDLIDEFIRL